MLKQQRRRATGSACALAAVFGLALTGLIPGAGAAYAAPPLVTDPAQYVNVFGGTGNGGGQVGTINDFPGPAMPFGMVQFAPDTNGTGTATQGAWSSGRNGSGYQWTHRTTRGFSMTHASQGCSLAGDIPIIPTTWNNLTASSGVNAMFQQRLTYAKPSGGVTWPRDGIDDEYGEVGYYRLNGADANNNRIISELGATTRGATATFTYPEGAAANVVLQASAHNNSSSYGSAIKVDPATGYVYARETSGNFCSKNNRYTVYYVLAFDRAWSGFGTWNSTLTGTNIMVADRTETEVASTTAHHDLGGYFTFPTAASGQTVVRARMAISYVSWENAKLNLDTEIPTLSATTLNTVRAANRAAWNNLIFSKIRVSEPLADGQLPAADPYRDLKTFYTAMYHSVSHPAAFSDVNGQYIGFEGPVSNGIQPKVHNTNEKPAAGGRQRVQYSMVSDWDTFRCQVGFMAMFWPDIAADLAQSEVNAAEQMGSFPQWMVANATTNQMTGDNVAPLIASIYALGGTDFEVDKALELLVDAAIGPNAGYWTGGTNEYYGNRLPMVQRPGAKLYNDKHYAPQARWYQADHAVTGASYTQEYAADDFALSLLAESRAAAQSSQTTASKYSDWSQHFRDRSHWWLNVYNPSVDFAQPRDLNGKFPEGNPQAQYTPDTTNALLNAFGWTHPGQNPDGFGQVGFDEGNTEQYTWYVPHDAAMLIKALGGPGAVEGRLESFFREKKVGPQVNASGGPYMFAGNEPNFNAPWLFNYTGSPWKSSRVVDEMTQGIFGYGPNDAAPGNDDLGAQSSLMNFLGIGADPVTPGADVMALNTPMFEQVVLTLPDGHKLEINSPGAQFQRDALQLDPKDRKYKYISSMKIDGVPHHDSWFKWSDILGKNTVIDYTVSDSEVGLTWASKPENFPPSWSEGIAGVLANLQPLGTTLPNVMGAAPGASASGRLDVQQMGSTSDTFTVELETPTPGITLRDGPVIEGTFNETGRATLGIIFKVSMWTASDIYPVTLVIESGGTVVRTEGHIRVAKPQSLEAQRNVVGSTYYAAARGRYNGTANNTYLRDELDDIGFTPLSVHDVTDVDGVTTTFTWPGAPHSYPESFGNGAQFSDILFDRPASQFSLVGTSVNGATTTYDATIWLTDGTKTRYERLPISLSDWLAPSTSGSAGEGTLQPRFDNSKVFYNRYYSVSTASPSGAYPKDETTGKTEDPFKNKPWPYTNVMPTLTAASVPNWTTGGAYMWATKTYQAAEGWKVWKITVPPGNSSETGARQRIWAIAQDRPTLQVDVDSLAVDAGDPINVTGTGYAANEEVTVWIASEPPGWAVIKADNLGNIDGSVMVPRSADIGEVSVLAEAASFIDPIEASLTVTVEDVFEMDPAVFAKQAVPGGAVKVTGTGFDYNETVVVTLDGQATAFDADGDGDFTGVVGAPDVEGLYDLDAVGLLSGAEATTQVEIVASLVVPGPTVTVPGPNVPVPGPTVVLPGPPPPMAGGFKVDTVKAAQSELRMVQGKAAAIAVKAFDAKGKTTRIKFSSSKPKVAKVSSFGRIKALKAGTTFIKAEAGGKFALIKVIVVAKKSAAKVTYLTASVPKEMTKGSVAFVAGKYKSQATKVKVRYFSSDVDVVKIDKVGRMKAVGVGTAKIKVTAGSKTKTYTVKVT
ncbi:MAG: GH92 family glycosyl hydrolase [Micrococcales bacterium]|nr:GH92 family glycosyl hydrolase [Micrococcales bacterium]